MRGERREMLEKEKTWRKAVIHLEATQLEDPILFNVGGSRFATSLETL